MKSYLMTLAIICLASPGAIADEPAPECRSRWSIAGVSIGTVLQTDGLIDEHGGVEVVRSPGETPGVVSLRAVVNEHGEVVEVRARVTVGVEFWSERFEAVAVSLGCEDFVTTETSRVRGSCASVIFSDCPFHALFVETDNGGEGDATITLLPGEQPYWEVELQPDGRRIYRRREVPPRQ